MSPTSLIGRVAALSMMGRAAEIKTVPYFWSAMFGKTIRYAGKCLLSPELLYQCHEVDMLQERETEVLLLHCHLVVQVEI